MPTPEEYCAISIEARLSRLQHSSGELEQAIAGKSDAELSRRPEPHSWGAKEIVCCGSGSWGGQRLRMADYVIGTGATREVPAAGGRSC
jgi:hypothetical protein